ncbi:serine-rich adhesin for platelets-like [Panonychus citri]|uniref:serine-rich adhesin for platelets-like n=1 Tax=Panonychus citri TaxID=50023 RepID=UPI0023071F1D|nr:serine-rich adhesin for platelets-like [Panonychus citri]
MFSSKGIHLIILIIISTLLIVDCQRENRSQSRRSDRFKKSTNSTSSTVSPTTSTSTSTSTTTTTTTIKSTEATSTSTTSPPTTSTTTESSKSSTIKSTENVGEKLSEIESLDSELASINNNGTGNKGWNAKLGFCREIVSQYGNDIRRVLLVGNFAFPTSRESIDAHCALGDRVYKALRKFSTSCLTSLPRQLFSIFLRGLRKLIKNVCHANKEKERAIEILKCTTESSLPGWNHCLNVANRQFESTAINSTDAQLFGDLCCMYNQLENCVRANLQKRSECSSKSFEVSKFFQQMIDATLKDVMDIACTKYATEGECIKNNNDGLTRLKSAADANFEVNDIFLIGPLLKIFPRLAND